MNTIEALQALKDGKKIKSNILKEGCYLYLDTFGYIRLVDLDGNKTIYQLSISNENTLDIEWEAFPKEPILTEEDKKLIKSYLSKFTIKPSYIVHKFVSEEGRDGYDGDYLNLWFPEGEYGISYEKYTTTIWFNEYRFENMEVDKKYTLEELGL